jgi:PAS domain S-box-containing protein
MLVATLVKQGRLVASLIVGDTEVRDWSGDAEALLMEVAERTWAAVERARAEAALRASEERQAFLLKLSDALRPLDDPTAIQAAAARLLRQQFDVGWCYYADFDETGQVATVLQDATREGLPSLAGRHDVSDVPEYVAFLRSGQLFETPDLATYPLFSPRIAERYSAMGVHALLGVPVVKDSGALSLLLMADTTPHPWPQDALHLIGEVAERTWAAVKRARAEAARRESEQRLKQFGEASTDVLWIRHAETLRWTYLSPAFEQIYGRTRESVLGPDDLHSWLDLVVPEDRPLVLGMVERVRVGEPVTFEYRIQWPDATVRWLRNSDFPIRDADDVIRHFAGTGRDVTDQKHAESALRESEERLRALNEQLEARVRERTSEVRSLFARLVSAQEEERRRIARDIHDQLGQQMTALRMNLEAWRAKANGDAAVREQADRTQRLAEELDQSIDFLTWQLRPAALDHLGLSAALRNLVAGWSERFGIAAEYDGSGDNGVRLPKDVEANLYRIVQEALHNVAKHAQATHVSVSMECGDHELIVVVEDNGGGFDPLPRFDADGQRLGLLNMRERATLAGGRLDIESTPGTGSAVFVRIPVVAPESA